MTVQLWGGFFVFLIFFFGETKIGLQVVTCMDLISFTDFFDKHDRVYKYDMKN